MSDRTRISNNLTTIFFCRYCYYCHCICFTLLPRKQPIDQHERKTLKFPQIYKITRKIQSLFPRICSISYDQEKISNALIHCTDLRAVLSSDHSHQFLDRLLNQGTQIGRSQRLSFYSFFLLICLKVVSYLLFNHTHFYKFLLPSISDTILGTRIAVMNVSLSPIIANILIFLSCLWNSSLWSFSNPIRQILDSESSFVSISPVSFSVFRRVGIQWMFAKMNGKKLTSNNE